RDHVAAHDAAEDVDEDPFYVGIREDDLEGGRHPLLGSAPTDIQKVGGVASIELDDVHGRHGQACAIDHAADIAVELDVIELVAPGLQLHGILFVLVTELCNFRMPEKRDRKSTRLNSSHVKISYAVFCLK